MFKKVETGTLVINEVADSEGVDVQDSGRRRVENTDPSQDLEGNKSEDKQELIYRKQGDSWKTTLLYNRWAHLIYLLLLCVMLGLIIPYILASFAFPGSNHTLDGFCYLNISYRFECLPGASPPPTRDECLALGCCHKTNTDDLYAPVCYHSIPSKYRYRVLNLTSSGTPGIKPTPEGPEEPEPKGRRTYRLSEMGEISIDLAPLRERTNFNEEAWSLRAKVQRAGSDIVRVLVYSPEHDLVDDDFTPEMSSSYKLNVTVTLDVDGDFNITVTRHATGEQIIETVFGPMIYSENYSELTTRIPTMKLYGLGLRRKFDLEPNFKHRDRWPLFTEEWTRMVDNTSVASGISGAHPFYMNFERTPGYMYGLYLRTAAPVEVGVLPIPAVVFRGVGTMWDLRIMAGPTPKDITDQYTRMVGRPAMPPYWALGYHLCRAAEPDFSTYDKVVKAMDTLKIPYESDCIDARLSYPQSFSPLSLQARQKVEALKRQGRKFMLAQYPFVTHGSKAYTDSKEFLLRHNDSEYYGSMEGVAVGYPDYGDKDVVSMWLNSSAEVRGLYEQADGVMLLHNTPLNQAQINYTLWNASEVSCAPETPEACCPDPLLPFLPSGVEDLNNHSLCSSLLHPSFGDSTHLRVHNAYGYHHHRSIHALMKEINPRTRNFITSQSTHSGSGAEGAAFGESFGANFMEQKEALVQVLELGLYGVPMAGVPICGSRNDTNGEVRNEWCLRGHQMAAFWPFMISHYEFGHESRNPTDLSHNFAEDLGVYIRMRYALLPYYYTLLHEASKNGTPMVRPLFYEFPHDKGSLTVSTQFMVGSSLLVSPLLQSVGERDSVDAQLYVPPGRWYNFFSGAIASDSPNSTNVVLPTMLADVNVHVKGGTILPLQGNLHDSVRNTHQSRQKNFTLNVALCCNESSETDDILARGSMYLDDGVTPHDLGLDVKAEHLEMTSTSNKLKVVRRTPLAGSHGLCSATTNADAVTATTADGLTATAETTDDTATPAAPITTTPYSTVINEIRVFGLPFVVKEVMVNGQPRKDFEQHGDTGTLNIHKIQYNWCSGVPLEVVWKS